MDDKVLRSLGSVIDDSFRRDAVHIAVVPAVAGQALAPGQRIRIGKNDAAYAVGTGNEPVAIVDPYLKFPLKSGQMFWAFLMPGSITSLRHEWEHPAFPMENSIPGEDTALSRRKAAAKKRLEALADKAGLSYDRLIEGMNNYVSGGDWIHLGTDYPSTYAGVWEDFTLLTGIEAPDANQHFFSCSC